MSNKKRFLALALATTMVVGCGLTAFAEDPVTEGTSTGSGTSEGHVEEKATSVTLPTVAEGSFSYIMDPEGLIKETESAKYADTVFPAAETDTGVYFNKGTNSDSKTVYENTSSAFKVINKSSHDVSLTVKAEVVSTDTDIPLVSKAALTNAANASLYLGLTVDTNTKEILKETPATTTVRIEGSADNFEIGVSEGSYVYQEITPQEGSELTWNEVAFNLEGAVTTGKKITDDTTAPQVKVTWSWVEPSEDEVVVDAAPSLATATATSSGDAVSVSVNLGGGDLGATDITKITFARADGSVKEMVRDTAYTYADGTLTFAESAIVAITDSREYTITFNDEAATAVKFTITKTTE